MSATDGTGKMPVLPGTIEVIVRIRASGVVADPTIIRMDMRGLRMTGLIHVRRSLLDRARRRRRADRSGTMGRNVTATDLMTGRSTALMTALLREGSDGTD
jgi:hypothetical protein